MPIRVLYHTFHQMLGKLRPGERVTRIRNFSWLLVGVYESRSVHLSKVADRIPGQACLPSMTRRMRRLLNNPAIRARRWYEPIAKEIIQRLADGEMRLIVDGSKVGFGHQLLLVAIAYRRRAIPLAWTWVKGSRGHSTVHKQKALLSYVHSLIPAKSSVLLVGDAEFGEVGVLKLLQKWHRHYVLRQKGRYLLRQKGLRSFQRLDSLVSKPGQIRWLEACQLTAKYAHSVNVLAYWKPGAKVPWLLATMRFIAHGENILLLGPPGVGKTHLAIALGTAAIAQRNSVYFLTWST